ncbi:hypothetical protein V7122_24270 [Bacillus sp. JJ1532]|uniref:hypothetical protein n=1 Tax=unclassified Bacillus (in: firmicutes) TaxID=185979 RepID=UPI002FFDC6E6
MQKVLLLFCFFVILVGCSNRSETEPIHPLFSNDESKYSLLVVDDTGIYNLDNEWKTKNGIKNVKKIHGRTSLEDTANSYKFLELEETPTFIVFDVKDVVFKTNSEEELIEFLLENNPN